MLRLLRKSAPDQRRLLLTPTVVVPATQRFSVCGSTRLSTMDRALNTLPAFTAVGGFQSTFAPASSGAGALCARRMRAPMRYVRTAHIIALGGAPAPPPPPPPPEESETTADVSAESDAKNSPPSPPPGEESTESPAEVTADDILNSPSFLKKKLEIVQKELLAARAEAEKADEAVKAEKSMYVRLAADFENYRRRSADDLRRQEGKSTAKVCRGIVEVLDNFERAIEAVKVETEREDRIHKSYQGIAKQLNDALAKLKVEPIDAVGTAFDPELHEAIQQLESKEHPEGVVCAQFRRGYVIEDSLIRASVVAVSKGPGPETIAEEAEATEAVDAQAEDVSTEVAAEGASTATESTEETK